jgi:hypothetical protein
MATTPRGYPYPTNSDAPNAPAQFQALATAIDTDVTNLPKPGFKQKPLAESVTSSIALQNDDDIFFSLGVGSWRLELFALVSGAVGGDVRMAWTFTGSEAGNSARACFGPGPTSTDVTDGTYRSSGHGFATPVIYGTAAGANAYVHEDISITVTVAGTFQLQWAQGTSSATATQLTSGTKAYLTSLTAL